MAGLSARDTEAVPNDLVLLHARLLGTSEAAPVDIHLRAGKVAQINPSGAAPAEAADVVDLDGRWVMPGLWDQHVHLTQWALAATRLDLSGARSAREAADLVRQRVAAPPADRTTLVGQGFHDALWPDAPSVALLDDAAGERPVVLVSGDLHCAWASSAGLTVMGAPWRADGMLREREWMPYMGLVVDDSAQSGAVMQALQRAAQLGVVGLVDFEVADNVTAWRNRDTAHLPVRVRAGVWEEYLDHVEAEGLRTGDPLSLADGLVVQGPLKVVADGALNTRTAWCADPYPGMSGENAYGVLSYPLGPLTALLTRARRAGLTCAVHAIGDAAVEVALDAFEASGARGSIEHVQLISPDTPQRMAAMGIVASVQPEHAMDDRDVVGHYWAGRESRAYAYATLAAAGVTLQFGSDAPVAQLDPWTAIDAAVTRRRDGRPAWHPEQALTLTQALAASTNARGIAPQVGAPADLMVLDEEPSARLTRLGTLRGTEAAATLVAGRWSYSTL